MDGEQTFEEKVLEMLERQQFVDWYEKELVPNYIEDSILSKETVLKKLKDFLHRS